MLERIRQIEIEEAVVDLLEEYGLSSYPISVGKILETLQIDPIPYSELAERERELALLASQDKAFNVTSRDYMRAQIVFDDTRGSYFYRARFSGGHELGHVWLEHEENTPNREIEADYYAGYLLAPHPLILTMEDQSINNVSERFGISKPCALVAIDQANASRREGGPWRPHEQWLINNVEWRGGSLIGRA